MAEGFVTRPGGSATPAHAKREDTDKTVNVSDFLTISVFVCLYLSVGETVIESFIETVSR